MGDLSHSKVVSHCVCPLYFVTIKFCLDQLMSIIIEHSFLEVLYCYIRRGIRFHLFLATYKGGLFSGFFVSRVSHVSVVRMREILLILVNTIIKCESEKKSKLGIKEESRLCS